MALVRGVMGTTAIEGNTLSTDEVRAIVERRSKLPPSMQYQEQEVANVVATLNAEIGEPREVGDLREDRLCKWNASILKDLELDTDIVPGAYRQLSVGVGRYRCPPPNEIPELMQSFLSWYRETFQETPEGFNPIEVAILKALAAHLYFVLIHPFGDGNGRTARLIEWFTLDCAGVPTSATHLLSDHYNLTRQVYVRKLEEASLGGNMMPFLIYALEGFVDRLAEQLRTIYHQYALLVFAETTRLADLGKTDATVKRRRDLAMAIANRREPVPTQAVSALSFDLITAYGNTTTKTITRDLHALRDANLITLGNNGWTPQLSPLYWGHRRRFVPPSAA